MKNLFIILLISVIAISAQAQDLEQEWASVDGNPIAYWCPVINAIVRDYGLHPFQRSAEMIFDVETILLGITQACAASGYTDALPSPSADSASPSPAPDGNVIIELSSATHPGTFISDEITLRPGLYSYASEGLGSFGWMGGVYVATHREPSYVGWDFSAWTTRMLDSCLSAGIAACGLRYGTAKGRTGACKLPARIRYRQVNAKNNAGSCPRQGEFLRSPFPLCPLWSNPIRANPHTPAPAPLAKNA